MRFFAVALIFFGVAASYAQTPEVPHKMRFADMTLTIRDDARREIQKDVDALTRSPKYFGIKVERARTYFPIIEKVFAEERVPDDFKYLVLQESALIADAVSVSNAVGFWQFKDFTAMEMGMRVDKEIDERMNIVSASRGAARYLKQSNFMFNNWLYALQAYQMGAGGVKRAVGDEFNGAKHMEINSDTYWYVKKFLAHKVAFEDAVKGEPQFKMEVVELKDKKEISELAKELGIEEDILRSSNKWIKSGTIPGDRTYALVLPNGKFKSDLSSLTVATVAVPTNSTADMMGKPADKPARKKINGVMAIQALPNESHSALASRAGIGLSELLKYNDITITDPVKAGEFYFTARKKNKSSAPNHHVVAGEDLWTISQHYGVSLKRIRKLNRISEEATLSPGDVVWLNARKPSAPQPVEESVAAVVAVAPVELGDFFDWEVNPDQAEIKSNALASVKSEVGSQPAITIKEEQKPMVIKKDNQLGIHTVVAGETLYSISKQYNVGVTQLLEWNQLDITKGIKPGQQLTVIDPAPASTQVEAKQTGDLKDQWLTHEVKTSDTLYSVARQYNVTIKEIMDWNDKSDFNLSQGEKLKILSR